MTEQEMKNKFDELWTLYWQYDFDNPSIQTRAHMFEAYKSGFSLGIRVASNNKFEPTRE